MPCDNANAMYAARAEQPWPYCAVESRPRAKPLLRSCNVSQAQLLSSCHPAARAYWLSCRQPAGREPACGLPSPPPQDIQVPLSNSASVQPPKRRCAINVLRFASPKLPHTLSVWQRQGAALYSRGLGPPRRSCALPGCTRGRSEAPTAPATSHRSAAQGALGPAWQQPCCAAAPTRLPPAPSHGPPPLRSSPAPKLLPGGRPQLVAPPARGLEAPPSRRGPPLLGPVCEVLHVCLHLLHSVAGQHVHNLLPKNEKDGVGGEPSVKCSAMCSRGLPVVPAEDAALQPAQPITHSVLPPRGSRGLAV